VNGASDARNYRSVAFVAGFVIYSLALIGFAAFGFAAVLPFDLPKILSAVVFFFVGVPLLVGSLLGFRRTQ
jgi:hypothetical protein